MEGSFSKSKFKVTLHRMARIAFNLISDFRLSRSSFFNEKHIYTLYTLSLNNYYANTYLGVIIVYKVKHDSSVDRFTWEQLAEGRTAVIHEMDLRGHMDPVLTGNESL